jgi:hypothetical protein
MKMHIPKITLIIEMPFFRKIMNLNASEGLLSSSRAGSE